MSSPLQAQIVQPSEDCYLLQDANFQKNFQYMVSRSEGCVKDLKCDLLFSHWKESPTVKIFMSSSATKTYNVLIENISESMSKISALTGLNLNFSNGNIPSLSIFVLDGDMIKMLESADFPHNIKDDFKRTHVNIYEQGGCSGIVFSKDANQSNFIIISGGFIFLNSKLTEFEMVNCLREELINSMGLVGDPIGQASLFDNGNYIDDNGLKDYSRETELMLYALYQIANGKYKNIEDLLNKNCPK